MESINSEYKCYKCYKCKKNISYYNKLLHDANCEMISDRKSNHDTDEKNTYVHPRSEYPEMERINLDVDKRYLINELNEKKEKDEYKLCKLCDVYLNVNEYEDHLICHKLEEELELSRSNNLLHGDIRLNNDNPNLTIHNNNNAKIATYNLEQNNDDLVCDFDLIEDEDEILKEIEEDEISKRKFEDKKNASSKKSNDGIIKNTISYLFDYKYRRLPPIVRIVGAIFDSRQLIRLAEDEIAARLAARIVEGPKSTNANDQEILLSLIPEINLQDVSNLPGDKRDCVICGDTYEKDQKISNLPCLHTFHSTCIKEWFKQKNLCPICKYEITKENFN